MACTWIDVDSRIIRARLSGVLTGSDLEEIRHRTAQAIARFGSVRCLFFLDDFRGWQSGDDWADVSFQEKHDAEMERIAIVGADEWRDEVLAFMAAPLRTTDIRYFDAPQSERADAWLRG